MTRLIHGAVVLYRVIHAVAYVISRYRLPAMPLMSILAAVGPRYPYVCWENFWSEQRQ